MLEKQISLDLGTAIKERNQSKIDALRFIKSALQIEKTSGDSHELSDEKIIKIIMKLSRQKQETYEMYKSSGRDESAQKELDEKKYIDYYLPKMLDNDQLKIIIDDIIRNKGYSTIKDMRSIMDTLAERYPGQYDGKAVGPLVKSLLGL